MAIDEPWYADLARRHGESFAREAGYFDEARPFNVRYGHRFDLSAFAAKPHAGQGCDVVQFSGAFYPFHAGHVGVVLAALGALKARQVAENSIRPVRFVIHADHLDYRRSKGRYDESLFLDAFARGLDGKVDWTLILEDAMENGCSRNFTRLYAELLDVNPSTWFLAGGDRANFALAFRERGRCIVAGRSSDPMHAKYRRLHDGARIVFLDGDDAFSSTAIRNAAP
ncbi:hypothetical protein ACVBGC_32245 [Burkholderia stagnalis]